MFGDFSKNCMANGPLDSCSNQTEHPAKELLGKQELDEYGGHEQENSEIESTDQRMIHREKQPRHVLCWPFFVWKIHGLAPNFP